MCVCVCVCVCGQEDEKGRREKEAVGKLPNCRRKGKWRKRREGESVRGEGQVCAFNVFTF